MLVAIKVGGEVQEPPDNEIEGPLYPVPGTSDVITTAEFTPTIDPTRQLPGVHLLVPEFQTGHNPLAIPVLVQSDKFVVSRASFCRIPLMLVKTYPLVAPDTVVVPMVRAEPDVVFVQIF